MTNDRLKYLLNKYLSGAATEEELQEYANWYRRQGENDTKLFEGAENETTETYKTELYGSIVNNIQFVEYEDRQRKSRLRRIYINIAAAALVVIAGTCVLYYGLSPKQTTVVANKTTGAPASKQHIVAVRNRTDKNTAVHLQDGSAVELSAGSELRYDEPFSAVNRHVYLSGKGFFKVAKDAARPFTVYSNDIATTALGTSFTITALPNNNNVSVALHTGKVVVQQTGNTAHMNDVFLTPGQEVSCNIITGKATMQHPVLVKTAAPSLGSRTGLEAAFTDEPIVNVLNAIEEGYAVQLQYDKDALADMIFTGRIRAKDSLSQVLNRMSLLYNLTVKEKGNKFIIQKSH
ncbi:FecR family protein [Niastella sp. OAS944]|uniref:FecR family protein n=1 Tax=Niastella sp. OAS944 TaxID=2664089 RepID=UPI0034909B59|nr:ferric-dicitrate binding protein FerR (iron transport regulator) [Chitinophagaceae bacterium OAS944]